MTTAFFALVRADLVLHFSNPRAVLMSVIAPILIAAFFGSLFGPGAGKPSRIPVAVTDLDRSPLTARIVSSLGSDEAFELTVTSVDDAQALLKAGKLRAALVLPSGFGAQAPGGLFGYGAKPEVQLTYDPSQETVLPIVRGLLAQHVTQQVSQDAFGAAGNGGSPLRDQVLAGAAAQPDLRRDLDTMFEGIARVQRRVPSSASEAASSAVAPSASAPGAGAAVGGFGLPFTTREIAAVARPEARYNGYAHAFAGMGVQFVLLMGMDIGIGLLTLRRQGLWKRLRAAPLSKAVLLGSRVVSCALIALAVQAAIYAVAIAIFGVRIEGSVIGLVGVMVAFGIFTASFGLLIAALGRTPEVTRGLAIVLTLLMVMIGGAWVPSFIFPSWLQQAALVVPTSWAINGLEAMTWRGLGIEAAVGPVLALLGFSALFTALAVWRFDWEE